MDTTASDITFDNDGVCNYCTGFLEKSRHLIHEDSATKERRLAGLVTQVKENGMGKPYDCIVGVSGGVDSSWTLVQVVRLGLRPLAVHMDNGWNSEIAQNNIANLVRGLGVDLYTHVIDWEEYRGLMQAFFDADVIDVELLYDNAMFAVNFQQANKYGIKHILAGSNTVTEGMPLAPGWNWNKLDKQNIYGIAKKFKKVKIKTFPAISTLEYFAYRYLKKITWVMFLDYLQYNKQDALCKLETEFGYKRYQFKHYESVFTRFYQGYILPNKFNVDKRLTHLSTMVVSGQMSRDEALKSLQGIPYPSEQDQENDINYFLKKMGWIREDLQSYIARPAIPHDVYPSENAWIINLVRTSKFLIPDFLRTRLKKN
jgi:N-acetyl sugar amidotransferase